MYNISKAQVPFAIVSDKCASFDADDKEYYIWISYEDPRSAQKKAQYVKQMSLGGISIWSLDMDDFTGKYCNLGAFPIVNSLRKELQHNKILSLAFENLASTMYPNKQSYTKINYEFQSKTKSSTAFFNATNLTTKTISKVSLTTTNVKIMNKTAPDENIVKYFRKFKAIRKIKISICLDQHKCNLNQACSVSSHTYFLLRFCSFFTLLNVLLKVNLFRKC